MFLVSWHFSKKNTVAHGRIGFAAFEFVEPTVLQLHLLWYLLGVYQDTRRRDEWRLQLVVRYLSIVCYRGGQVGRCLLPFWDSCVVVDCNMGWSHRGLNNEHPILVLRFLCRGCTVNHVCTACDGIPVATLSALPLRDKTLAKIDNPPTYFIIQDGLYFTPETSVRRDVSE